MCTYYGLSIYSVSSYSCINYTKILYSRALARNFACWVLIEKLWVLSEKAVGAL